MDCGSTELSDDLDVLPMDAWGCGVGIKVLSSTFLSSIEGSGTMTSGRISPRLKYPSLGLSSSLKDSPSESSAVYRLSGSGGISSAQCCSLGIARVAPRKCLPSQVKYYN